MILCKLYKIFLYGIVRIDLNFAIEAHTEGTLWYIAAVRNLGSSYDLAGCKSCLLGSNMSTSNFNADAVNIKGMDLCVLYIGYRRWPWLVAFLVAIATDHLAQASLGSSGLSLVFKLDEQEIWMTSSFKKFLPCFICSALEHKEKSYSSTRQVSSARLDIDRLLPFSFFSMGPW